MNKKISLGAAITFALIIAAAVFSITMVYSRIETNKILNDIEGRKMLYTKFSEIDDKVNQKYYGDIDRKMREDSIARGYMQGLDDPYAKYYTAEEYALLSDTDLQDKASIGIDVRPSADGYLEITKVQLDSPAYTAGIRENSLIVEIDDVNVTSDNNEELAHKVTGSEGSKLTLMVRKDGNDQYYDLTLRILEDQTVTWKILDNTDIGYIRITSFDNNTSNQFNRALQEIQQAEGKFLIFDVRSNSSTDLGTAPRILDRLVPAGVLISTVNRNGEVQELEFSDANELNLPMVVLVNGQTAGMSEMFAQVLKDYGKAKIVGTTTAGRGVMLDTVRLSDGSALEFTVGLYQSPSGVTLDGEGIKPDFDVSITGVEDQDWEKLTPESDTQLIKAQEVVSAS